MGRYDDDREEVGYTFYNDLYAKKSPKQAEIEADQWCYKDLTKKEREKLYRKKAINPLGGLLFIPCFMVFYLFLGSGYNLFSLEFIKACIIFFKEDPVETFTLFLMGLVFTGPFIFLFALFAIEHNQDWRHRLGSYDAKRDAQDIAAEIALGVSAKRAVKNSKDLITKPLSPEEAHF